MDDIKLLALDLDGTLFNAKKEISVANKEALAAAKRQGVKVVITTGRPLKAIEHILEELDLLHEDDYSITFNGGLVQQNTGHILHKSQLSREELEDIVALAHRLDLPVDVLSEGVVYSLPSQTHASLYHTANPTLTFKTINHLDDLPEGAVFNKAVIVYDAEFLDQQIAKIPQVFSEQFEVFKSRDIILEIMPKGVHKATGLAVLTEHLGLVANQVMAMGDEENDLSMIEWAGWGVAMQNAVASLKEKANAVTRETNENSGVAEAVRQYILKEG